MLRYLSKFVVDILPPVFATVVGAWIVTHYINPKIDAAQPKTEAAAPKALLSGASGMSPRAVEQVAVKPVVDEAAEAKKAAAREKPVAVKQAVAAPRVEEKQATRDTTDLVRAALERQRNQAPPEPSHATQPTLQPVAAPAMVSAPPPTPVVVPQVAAAPAPAALPPPIVIAPQREATAQPSPSLFGDMGRPTPPADIPVRSADASVQPGPEGRSLIGGIASAAKSLVDVVIPR